METLELFTKDGMYNNAALLAILDKITVDDLKKIIDLGVVDDNDVNGRKILGLLEEILSRNE